MNMRNTHSLTLFFQSFSESTHYFRRKFEMQKSKCIIGMGNCHFLYSQVRSKNDCWSKWFIRYEFQIDHTFANTQFFHFLTYSIRRFQVRMFIHIYVVETSHRKCGLYVFLRHLFNVTAVRLDSFFFAFFF